uniref:Myb-like domain-containing protein n=1 Tax=Rhizophagus irregularis (strain DAOM 181602 / DAOM 197198 / MUCL 43194) TaxID=747089 RepID=U9U2R5_RHIID
MIFFKYGAVHIIHSLSQLEFDHPDHPTLNDCRHKQELGQEDYQVNLLPQSQSDDASKGYYGLSVDVLPKETSYLDYNVDNPNQELTESSGEGVARKLSWNSSTLVCESPRQMTFSSESSTLVCESPRQMTFSSESSTLVCESSRQMSFSSESPTLVCESPRQMSESPRQISFSGKSTSMYKRLKRMSLSAWSGSKSRKLSSGKNTKRCTWKDEAVKCLLLYLKENINKIEKLSDPHSGVKVELWNGASKWMLVNGHDLSPEQCYNRWRNNKQRYMGGRLKQNYFQMASQHYLQEITIKVYLFTNQTIAEVLFAVAKYKLY